MRISDWSSDVCSSDLADERTRLLATGQARAAGQDSDPLPVVRLFTPDAHATWLLASLDPADGDTAHGLIDLGIGMPALGKVKLSDLAAIVRPREQPVVRDRYFQPLRRLSDDLDRSEVVRLGEKFVSTCNSSSAHWK